MSYHDMYLVVGRITASDSARLWFFSTRFLMLLNAELSVSSHYQTHSNWVRWFYPFLQQVFRHFFSWSAVWRNCHAKCHWVY